MTAGTRWIEEKRGWRRLPVPLPFALKWVNAYLLPEEGGWTVVDPGLRSPDAEACWTEALASLGVGWSAIRRIVLTHHHPDHYGLAGWMQERSGAPVYLSAVAHRYAHLLWGEEETFTDRLPTAFARHGLPPELQEAVRGHLRSVRDGQVQPHPTDVRLLEPGTRITMGDAEWELIGGEGHAPGHLSFYDSRRRVLLCGDQVLPDITPNIGWMPDADPDPLGSFLDSLRRLQRCDADEAFPGHRSPFGDFQTRVAELLAHHDRRLSAIAAIVAEEGPLTAFACCERLFGTRLRRNPHNLRFALAETIAHLERLAFSGDLCRVEAEEAGPDTFWITYKA